VAFLLIAPQVIGIVFGLTSPEALALLKPALRLYALYIPFSAALLLLQNFYNTTERRSLATSLVVMDGLLFVVPFAVLLSRIQSNLLWLSYAASGACTLFVLLLLARRIRKKEDVQGLLLIRERTTTSTNLILPSKQPGRRLSGCLSGLWLLRRKRLLTPAC